MRDRLRETLAELARDVRGMRVILIGFSRDGFPSGDGANEAAAELPLAGVSCVRTHAGDPELLSKLSDRYDVAITMNTRVKEVLTLPRETWSCADQSVYWYWDIRPGGVVAPLRGKFQHVFTVHYGDWKDDRGKQHAPSAFGLSLGCPVRYCPQGAPLREPELREGAPRVLFVGHIDRRSLHHRSRGPVCQELGAKVVDARPYDKRVLIERRLPHLYRSSRYVLSLSPLIAGYTSVRTFSILACGGLMVLHKYPGSERLFRDGEHAILFDDVQQVKARLKKLDNEPETRRRIADNGRRLHAERHTVAHRVLSICRQVAGVDKGFCGWL